MLNNLNNNDKIKLFLKNVFDRDLAMKFTNDIEKLAAIDAFIQFAQNPTSMSAGYGIEQNYPYIMKNLAIRYNLKEPFINDIILFLKEIVKDMEKLTTDFYTWRNAIKNYIVNNYTDNFLEWYEKVYANLGFKERNEFLFLLYALSNTTYVNDLHKWYVCFLTKKKKLHNMT